MNQSLKYILIENKCYVECYFKYWIRIYLEYKYYE